MATKILAPIVYLLCLPCDTEIPDDEYAEHRCPEDELPGYDECESWREGDL